MKVRRQNMSVAEAKDWISMIFTVFQSLLFVLASVYWNMKNRKEEKRKLDRELREKIADLFSQDLDEIEETSENIQKTTSSLKKQQIIVDAEGNTVISAHDVLKYMCQLNKREEYKTEALEEFCSDVDKMMKLFRTLRIKFPPIARGRKCPVNIEEELGQTIVETAKSILPFASETRVNTINEVLKYFNASPKSSSSCRDVPPSTYSPGAVRPGTSSSGAVPQSSGLEMHPGLQSSDPEHTSPDEESRNFTETELRDKIPYLRQFRMEAKGKITFKITDDMSELNSNIINVENSLEKNELGIINQISEISDKMKSVWSSTGKPMPDLDWSKATNVLHFLRLLIYTWYKEKNLPNHEELEKYLKSVDRDPVRLNANVNKTKCLRIIDDIKSKVKLLKGEQFAELLGTEGAAKFLGELSKSVEDKFRVFRNDENNKDYFSGGARQKRGGIQAPVGEPPRSNSCPRASCSTAD